MKTDKNGCSTCPPGEERWEKYYSELMGGYQIQYDYRTSDGKLFSCITKHLDQARSKRDAWLNKQNNDRFVE